MKRHALLLPLLLLSNWAFAQFAPHLPEIDAALSELHANGSFNGTVLLAENGKIVFQKTLGFADPETQKPLDSHSAFELASISKQFVAMLVMIQQEKGNLRYGDPVKKYLPEFPYDHVTIRHLLTNTSGVVPYFDLVLQQNNTLDTLTNQKLLQLLADQRPDLHFPPGSKWEYSNTGFVMLALIVEKLSGMPFEQYFQQAIAQPLGMKDSWCYTVQMKESPANRVKGLKRDNGVRILNDLNRFDGVIGDRNIFASAEDLLKWDQALYTEKLVSKKTLQEAFAPIQLTDGTISNYGFGWTILPDSKEHFHTGAWMGFVNRFQRDPEHKRCIILLTNGSDGTARQVVMDILGGKNPELPKFTRIYNVQILDGTGAPARPGSVRLRNDQIWEIGDLQALPVEAQIDGNGRYLAPGFIDSHSHHLGGLEEHPDAIAPLNQGVTTIVSGQDGESYLMDSIAAFFKRRPVAINVATYTGQATLRAMVMGENDLFRTARPKEVEKMKAILQTEMEKGSLGLSTGLEYEEAFFSNRSEVIALAKVAAANHGRYISHIRSEDIQMEEAIDEIIDIGRQAKLPVQISHIKIAKRDNWGHSRQLLATLQQARSEGIDITADCYPYDFWMSTLRVLFPKRDYANPESAKLAVNQLFDPQKSILVRFAPQLEYAGKTITQIADARHEDPATTLMFLVAAASRFREENPNSSVRIEAIMGKSMDEPDVANFLQWPYTNICSDGGWSGHPRGYGAFTRVLGRYVREQQIMPLETAVFKMTGLAAEHLGFDDRGLIAKGYYADLVLFNPETVRDNANVQDNKLLSDGIEMVWVNGVLVYKDKQTSGQYPGMFITRNDHN